MISKTKDLGKKRNSKKHGKQQKLIERKLKNHIPLSKTEKESHVLRKYIK